MSQPFAEATVHISPSLRGFVKDLDEQLKVAMAKAKQPVIRVRPALTKDFVGDLRRQVNAAVAQAQSRVKPIIIKTVIQTPSRRQLANVVQAPVTLSAIGGTPTPPVSPTAGAERPIPASFVREATLLGGIQVAEEKVTQARQRGNVVRKQTETREQQVARAEKLSQQALKGISEAPFVAAARGGTELSKARAELAEKTKALGIAEKARATSLTKTTRDVHESAKAERQLAFERVQALETSTKGVVSGITATRPAALQRIRSSTAQALVDLREADAASVKLGKSTKDLAAVQDILSQRTSALNRLRRLSKAAILDEDQATRKSILSARTYGETSVAASRQQVKALQEQGRAASKAARSSEQLSRGGQASLLSLAGIRGATLAASRSFLVGAAAITVFAKAVKSFADLQQNLQVFQATTSATAAQMELVREASRKLGADLTLPAVSAADAAGAMVELSKAGLSVEDSIAGARGVLELATAAAIDNAAATQLVANALNAFQMQGKDAVIVADTLANAANAAQGSIADIGTAMQQANSAGRQVGLSFQDTATFLTILAKNGLRGADAGTSLRTALIRLVNPSKAAADQFKKLGIEIRDTQGNIRPDVFIQIASAAEKLGPAQRDATIALIGGQDAFRAVTILGRQSIASFLQLRAELRKQGTAADLAAARTKGLHGAMDALQSVLETVGTTAAGHVGPALARMVRGIASGITTLSENNQVALTLNQSLEGLAQGFNLVGQAIRGVATVALPVINVLSQIVTAIGVNTILGGVLAYKVLGGTLARVTQAYKNARLAIHAFEATQGVAFLSMAGMRTAILGAAKSFNLYVLAAAAATAGLIFLLTRQSATEQATNSLVKATQALAQSYDQLKDATEGVATAQRNVTQLQNALTQASINQQRAQQELRASDAPRGSNERRQLLLDVLVTTQDVTFATKDYTKALKDLKTAEEDQAAARDRIKQTLADQIARTKSLLQLEVERNQSQFRFRPDLSAELKRNKLLGDTLNVLDKVIKKDTESGNKQQEAFGRRTALIRGFIAQTKNVHVPDMIIRAVFKAPDLKTALARIVKDMKFTSESARQEFIKGLVKLTGLGPAMRQALLDELIPSTQNAVHTAAEWIRHKGIGEDIGKGIGENAAKGFKLTFDSKLLEAQALGASKQVQLAIARQGLADAQRTLQRDEAKLPPQGQRTKEQQATIDADAQAVINAQQEVARIEGDIASASREAAQKVKDAQQNRDAQGQKVVDQVLQGRRATILQRKITTAGLTAQLGDDLKTNQVWLAYLKNSKDVIRKRLQAIGASKAVISAAMKQINDLIFATTNEIIRIKNDQAQAMKDQRAALLAIVNEKLDLRIQIAEKRGDVKAQLAAHRAKLREINIELARARKQYGRNSVEWLRLKAAQVDEIAAINELKKTTGQRNDALAKLAFEFLQAQQGFTASLLSNLFPTNPAPLSGGPGGTPVVATSSAASAGVKLPPGAHPPGHEPKAGFGPGANLARAQATAGTQGSTAGQMSLLISVNQKMLAVLQVLANDTKHPGAKGNARANSTKNFATHK